MCAARLAHGRRRRRDHPMRRPTTAWRCLAMSVVIVVALGLFLPLVAALALLGLT